MEGFSKIRNGLLDHALTGKLSPFDFGLYVFLIMRANFRTGIYDGCALTIAYQFGNPGLKEHVQKALRRLKDRQFINYRNGDGRRGAYQILVNKYDITDGELSGTRLNAWKHNGLATPEYERENGSGTVVELSRHGDGTVVAPNEYMKTIRPEDLKKPSAPVGAKNRGTTLPDDFAVTEEHRQYAAAHALIDPDKEIENFELYWKANASSRTAKKSNWDSAFKFWLRTATQNHKTKTGANYAHTNNPNSRTEGIRADMAAALRSVVGK